MLCWDIFDFLEPAAAKALAGEVVRVLRPGGAVMGFFCTKAVERAAVHEIRDRRGRPSRCGTAIIRAPADRSSVLQNRDIIKMFEGLTVAESFLLKSNTREILLRKRAVMLRPVHRAR